MESEEWVAGNSFRDQLRMASVRVFLVGKVGVSELVTGPSVFGPSVGTVTYLPLLGLVHDMRLVTVNANVFELALRPTNSFSVQFLEPSLLHGVTDDRNPYRVPALTWVRTHFRVVRSIYNKPVTSWNLAIEKTRFWYESNA